MSAIIIMGAAAKWSRFRILEDASRLRCKALSPDERLRNEVMASRGDFDGFRTHHACFAGRARPEKSSKHVGPLPTVRVSRRHARLGRIVSVLR